jgi:hypothetical protein
MSRVRPRHVLAAKFATVSLTVHLLSTQQVVVKLALILYLLLEEKTSFVLLSIVLER